MPLIVCVLKLNEKVNLSASVSPSLPPSTLPSCWSRRSVTCWLSGERYDREPVYVRQPLSVHVPPWADPTAVPAALPVDPSEKIPLPSGMPIFTLRLPWSLPLSVWMTPSEMILRQEKGREEDMPQERRGTTEVRTGEQRHWKDLVQGITKRDSGQISPIAKDRGREGGKKVHKIFKDVH